MSVAINNFLLTLKPIQYVAKKESLEKTVKVSLLLMFRL